VHIAHRSPSTTTLPGVAVPQAGLVTVELVATLPTLGLYDLGQNARSVRISFCPTIGSVALDLFANVSHHVFAEEYVTLADGGLRKLASKGEVSDRRWLSVHQLCNFRSIQNFFVHVDSHAAGLVAWT
jgi:hypothetical protein